MHSRKIVFYISTRTLFSKVRVLEVILVWSSLLKFAELLNYNHFQISVFSESW